MRSVSGIYKITCNSNGKIYIGYSKNMYTRKVKHVGKLRLGKHPNAHLQSAWNKYTEGDFMFTEIEECTIDKLKERENYWCHFYKSHDRNIGFNIEPTVNGETPKRSDETKLKLSIYNKGKILSECHIDKIKFARSKQIITDSHKKAISLSHKGKVLTESHKRAISTSRKLSDKVYTNDNLKKKVVQKDIADKVIKIWDSASDAGRDLQFQRGKICLCCLGKRKFHKGFKWSYEGDIHLV